MKSVMMKSSPALPHSLPRLPAGRIAGMDEERKPVWPWIVALLIGLPVSYVAAFGPACWTARRLSRSERSSILKAYWPLSWISIHSPDFFYGPLCAYGGLMSKGDRFAHKALDQAIEPKWDR
jgi:hypothetical protein